ncbi:MFS transporter [Mesorhizobium sp. Z1-4]|uniref:MFS transporter n=1 Tax=Mesorhizobium sp. Z1-4 TaxID=2448478 RepID=UPI000FDC78D0|nr:MFS transporter [Mesorhizobium sp. Z1-4]
MIDTRRRLAAISMLLVAGILAGTQLGKIAPLIGWYRDDAGMSLVAIGWLTALLGLFVALASLPAAFAISRAGLYRSFIFSTVLLFIGGIGIATFESQTAVLAARLVEALGYLPLVIAVPALVSALAPAEFKAPALAIWGGFVPIGFAIADFLASAMVPVFGERAFLATVVAGFGAASLLAGWLAYGLEAVDEPPKPQGLPPIRASASTDVLLVAAAFGVYVTLSIAFFAFLPEFIQSGRSDLAIAAGVIALVVPVGNIFTGYVMKGRRARFAMLLCIAGFLGTAVSALPMFSPSGVVASTAAAVVYAIASGVIASALFASVPFIVPAGGSASVAIGIIAQAGGITTVVAPPVAGYVIERFGFPGLGWFLALSSLLGPVLLAPLLRRRRAGLVD